MSQSLVSRLRELSTATRNVAAGASLFFQGDRVEAMYLIEAGSVRLIRHQENGSMLVLQRARPGEVLAEASLFSDIYHCDAVAANATTCLAVPRSELRRRLAADPELADMWITHLAHAVQTARLRAEILTLRTVAERIDAWLAMRQGRMPAKGDWKELAAEIGVSPEALYRELARRREV